MAAPNNGDCPYCKGKKTLYLYREDPKTKKQYWKCSKCGEVVSK